MKVKIVKDNFISPILRNPQAGQIVDLPDPEGQHLVDAGVAINLKMGKPTQKKPEGGVSTKAESGSASQADQALTTQTAPKRRGRPKKL